MPTYNIQGKLISIRNGLPVPHANIEIFEVNNVGTIYTLTPMGQTASNDDGTFTIDFNYPIAHPNRPDIIFRVSQNFNGTTKYIYNENPAEDTRWNIADVLYVTLKIEEDCMTSNNTVKPPINSKFVFTRVGLIAIADIDQASGYAYTKINPITHPIMNEDSNVPFGRTLDIAGWFGTQTDVQYYKIQYSNDGVNWHDISDPLYNSWYDDTPNDPHWVTESLGPTQVSNTQNLYKRIRPENTPYTYPDLIAQWDTTKVPNGLYTLKIIGKKLDVNNNPVDATNLNIDLLYGTMKILIDNTPPTSHISRIWHVDGNGVITELAPCTFAHFKDGSIFVTFEASDTEGYLRCYTLNAYYGHNQVVVPTPINPKAVDDYSAHLPSKSWNGGTFTIEYKASQYDSVEMPPCAYQFRLDVDKRTTNGYGLVYYGYEDTWHITIIRQ